MQGEGDDGNHYVSTSYISGPDDVYLGQEGVFYDSLISLAQAAGIEVICTTSHEYLENHVAAWAAAGILSIQSGELHDDIIRESDTHILGLGIYDGTATAMEPYMYYQINGQTIINRITEKGGMAIIAHPNIDWAIWGPTAFGVTLEELRALQGYHGLEVIGWREIADSGYTTKDKVYADGNFGGINKIDPILTDVATGVRTGFVSLTAGSDFHRIAMLLNDQLWPHRIDDSFQIVFSTELTSVAVMANLKAGNSYATTGPLLATAPAVVGNTISLTTADLCTCRWIKENGTVARTDAAATTFTFTATDELYIRAELKRVSDEMFIWTQPFYTNFAIMLDPTIKLINADLTATTLYNSIGLRVH